MNFVVSLGFQMTTIKFFTIFILCWYVAFSESFGDARFFCCFQT